MVSAVAAAVTPLMMSGLIDLISPHGSSGQELMNSFARGTVVQELGRGVSNEDYFGRPEIDEVKTRFSSWP